MINEIMQAMATYLGIPVIVSNQESLPYVLYGEYEVVKTEFEQPYRRIRTQSDAGGDMVEIVNYYGTSSVIRLTFYNSGTTGDILDAIMTHARNAWMWLNEEGKDICRQYNVVPHFMSREIHRDEEDIPTLPANKQKVEFEFALRGTVEKVSSIETINTVDYTMEPHV